MPGFRRESRNGLGTKILGRKMKDESVVPLTCSGKELESQEKSGGGRKRTNTSLDISCYI